MMKHLYIADKQAISQAGLIHIASKLGVFGSIETIGHKNVLVKKLVDEPNDSVVIVDYELFDYVSVEELLIISDRFPACFWIVFSENLTDEFVKKAAYEGSNVSIVMKSAALEEIQTALRFSLRDEKYFCQRVKNQLATIEKLSKEKSETSLTATEKEILKAIALGKTTKEIASERNLSFHTVISHRKNIFRKLDVNNIHEATKYAMRAGIVDLSEYYI